ncbi:hypothetical protein Emtol_0317 (plasmid) [Emticicia oligotrophica DSM 17448]|uniref:Transmembrane protein n=1 Tax=Emticicia oligotrophica (strain DSM 17448 / CIP 109782 / MTCC 6937 / GPTSA100-15) TaxID=929562 RepID=A0ABM5N7Z3_EMTOG|nr:hypothetical protein [Emticicia oligotrophica]AFK05584.1 hypothetical protein Emtol_0317 [Emticicia oligotrophica DSM 17448]
MRMLIAISTILLKQFQPIISLSNYVILSVILSIIILLFLEVKSKGLDKIETKKAESMPLKNPSNMNIMGENKDATFFGLHRNEPKNVERQSTFQNEIKVPFQTIEIKEERQVVKSTSGFHVDGELPNLDDLTDQDFNIIIFEDEIEDDYYEKESLDILEIKKKFDSGESLTDDEQTILDTFFRTEEQWKDSAQIIIEKEKTTNIDFEPKSEQLENMIPIENNLCKQNFNYPLNQNVQFNEEFESKLIFDEYLN